MDIKTPIQLEENLQIVNQQPQRKETRRERVRKEIDNAVEEKENGQDDFEQRLKKYSRFPACKRLKFVKQTREFKNMSHLADCK